jgi:hypothetical protein
MDVNCNDIGSLLVIAFANELMNVNFKEKTIETKQTQGN